MAKKNIHKAIHKKSASVGSENHEHSHAHASTEMSGKEKRNFKNSIIAVVVIVLVAIIILVIAFFPKGGNDIKESIVATVGSDKITSAELEAEFLTLPSNYQGLVTKRMYLEKVMIPQKLLLMKATDIGESEVQGVYSEYLVANNLTEEQLSQMLLTQGVSKQKFLDLIKVQLFLNKTVYNNIQVTEEEMLEMYDMSKESLKDQDGNLIAYEDVKDDIKSYLYNQKMQTESEAYITQLMGQNQIQIMLPEDPVADASTAQANAASASTAAAGNAGATGASASNAGSTFKDSGDEICKIDGKPVVRLFSTTWCPHCKWVKETFDSTVKEYADSGLIVAHHWEVDVNDDTLTSATETEVPAEEMAVFTKYNPQGSVPVFVFGCKYVRLGNGYERADDLGAEKAEFKKVIEELIASS